MCDHKEKVDLTSGLGEVRHYYCRKCGWHKYKEIEYTSKEWDIKFRDVKK